MPKSKLIGEVVSASNKKTVVVEVERIKEHPKYKRRYKVHKRYKAHDEKEEAKVGDKVMIEECRPVSRDKRWKVTEIVTTRKISPENEENFTQEKNTENQE